MTVETRELRHDVPKRLVDALDGLALATGQTRQAVVIAILEQYVDQEIHKATVLLRYAGVTGSIRSKPE